jgi:hypothetical protein
VWRERFFPLVEMIFGIGSGNEELVEIGSAKE